MKEILWLLVPSKQNIKDTNGMIFMIYALIAMIPFMAYLGELSDQKNQELKIMPCQELKKHILNEDFMGISLSEQEHQYTWRCDK